MEHLSDPLARLMDNWVWAFEAFAIKHFVSKVFELVHGWLGWLFWCISVFTVKLAGLYIHAKLVEDEKSIFNMMYDASL